MVNRNSSLIEKRISNAIAWLSALRDLDQAVLELEACGQAAVEPLREFLFTRDRSGIFEPRCRAVEVLAALGAKEVLLDFLARFGLKCTSESELEAESRELKDDREKQLMSRGECLNENFEHQTSNHNIPDPVEQAGDEAVANAAARALMKWPDEDVFSLLLEISSCKLLAGVVEGLAEYGRPETIPIFAVALGDDFYRSAAVKAFRKLGSQACPCLLQLAATAAPSQDFETESSRRLRRCALKLFSELYQGGDLPAGLYSLMMDADPQVAFLACSFSLPRVSAAERDKVAALLVDLLDTSDWLFRAEVEELLIRNYENFRPVIIRRINLAGEPAAAALQRIVRKAEGADGIS